MHSPVLEDYTDVRRMWCIETLTAMDRGNVASANDTMQLPTQKQSANRTSMTYVTSMLKGYRHDSGYPRTMRACWDLNPDLAMKMRLCH